MELRGGLILIISFLTINSFAAGEMTVTGGRAAAMGNTCIAISDSWSGFNNQAGLGWSKKFTAGAYYENRFLVKELSLKSIGAIFPVKKGAFGLSFRYFGFSQYNEIKTGLAYGMRFGNSFSAGIQLDYLHFYIGEDYGSKSLFTFELGFQYRIKEKLCLGVHLFSPVPVRVTDNPLERLPAVIRLGMVWETSKNFITSAEVEKDLLNKPVFKAGVEYHFVNPLYLRIGFLTNPTQFTFGFGLEFGKLIFDVASSYQPVLGFSPQGSIIYIFK